MNTSLLPIFRSDSQAAVLNALLRSPFPLSTRQITDETGLAQPSAHRELRRLSDAGIVRESRVGRSALFEPVDSNPAVGPLRTLVSIAFGPQSLLTEALRGIEGIERALIFGSFAARSEGLGGASPDDIDLLIVGDPNRRNVYDALDGVDAIVRREINVTFLRPSRWEAGEEEVVRRIKENPVIDVTPA
jgi:DNA-binding transcriptional ArsR family regulator